MNWITVSLIVTTLTNFLVPQWVTSANRLFFAAQHESGCIDLTIRRFKSSRMLRRVGLVNSYRHLGTAYCPFLRDRSDQSSNCLTMKERGSLETSVTIYQSTLRNIIQDLNTYQNSCWEPQVSSLSLDKSLILCIAIISSHTTYVVGFKSFRPD